MEIISTNLQPQFEECGLLREESFELLKNIVERYYGKANSGLLPINFKNRK